MYLRGCPFLLDELLDLVDIAQPVDLFSGDGSSNLGFLILDENLDRSLNLS